MALWGAGVLTLDESKAIERGLDAVAARLEGGEQPQPSDEDVHTLIDRLLHEEVGDVASKLHTGRSRNDQVATATRLWTMDVCQQLDGALRVLQRTMVEQARTLETALMPSYTHLQRAIPVSGGALAALALLAARARSRAPPRRPSLGGRPAARLRRGGRLRLSDLARPAFRARSASTRSRRTRSTP